MSGRLSRLFARYASRHLALDLPRPATGAVTGTETGAEIGAETGAVTLDRVALGHGLIVVEGRAPVPRVTLDLAGRQDAATPDAQGRFRLALPAAPEAAVLTLGDRRLTLAPPAPLRLALGQAVLLPGFALALAAAAPAGLRWLRRRDPADRRRIKRRLGLDEAPPLPPALSKRTTPR